MPRKYSLIIRTLRKSYVLRLVLFTGALYGVLIRPPEAAHKAAAFRRRLNNAAAAQTYSIVIRG